MTIICAASDGQKTWLGCDTMVSFGDSQPPMFMATKWILSNGWAWGFTGSARTPQLVAQAAAAVFEGTDPIAVADRVRKLVVDDGYKAYDSHGAPQSWVDDMCLARAGKLWRMCSEYTVIPVQARSLFALGHGMSYALGADDAMCLGRSPSIKRRVEIAIQVAINLDYYCGGEPWFHVLK